MSDDEVRNAAPPPEPDTGLRQLLTYTFIALVIVLIAAAIMVPLVIRWFGPGSQ